MHVYKKNELFIYLFALSLANGVEAVVFLLVSVDNIWLVSAGGLLLLLLLLLHLAHQVATLNSGNIRYNKVVFVRGILGQIKLNVLALHKVTKLIIDDLDRTVVDEDVLAVVLAALQSDKSVSSLVIKPFNTTN